MEAAQKQELQLRDYLRIFRKRIRLILGVLGIVVAVALVYSFLTPNTYQSSATVEVQGQSGFVIKAQPQMDDSSGNLTPTTLTVLIGSQPYQELASSLLVLCPGYHMDLTARRSQDDMVQLFEGDLLRKGLPAYFGRLALQSSSRSRHRLEGFSLDLSPPPVDDSALGNISQLSRRLSSSEKDEAIKEAGALAALARRFHIDLFSLDASAIEPKAIEIMDSPLVRDLRTQPLQGRRWEDLSPLERGAAVQAAYRDVQEHEPDQENKREVKERYSTREVKDTGMLDVDFESADPFRAMLGADAMVDTIVWKNQYLRKQEAQRYRQVTEEALYGSNDKGGATELLRKTVRDVRNYKKSHHMPDMEVMRETLSKQVTQLRSDYMTAAAGAAGARKQVGLLQANLDTLSVTSQSPTVAENPMIGAMHADLAKAEADLRGALAQYTPENPIAQAAQARVTSLQNELNAVTRRQPKTREVRISGNPVYEQLLEDLSKAKAAVINWQTVSQADGEQLRLAEGRLDTIPDTEYDLFGIIQQQTQLSGNLKVLSEKYLDAQLNEATKMSNARVVQLALEPGKKIRPRRTMNVIFSVLLGLFLGLAGSVFAETIDTRIHSSDELERVLPGIPVLAAIPVFSGDHPLIAPSEGGSAAAEAFRALRSAIRFLDSDRPLRLLVVTSPGFREGKSTVAANLAAAIAQSGQKVILLDADLRHPVQHEILGTPYSTGLSTLLAGDGSIDAALQRTSIEGLSLLPAGPIPPNPTELLDSGGMRSLVEELGRRADVVLFDAPAVGAATDAAVLGSLAEGVLLVVGAGQTPRESIVRASRSLGRSRSRLVGAVLNRADPSMSESAGRYRNGAGSGPSGNGYRKSGVRRIGGVKDEA